MIHTEPAMEIPAVVLSSPALLFLFYRIEQILGIKATSETLLKLNEHLEKHCGASFVENPAAYEQVLTSREQIFNISEIVTVNETYFFREGAHFNLLVSFLPQLIKLNRPLRICSAATSIGCEAYSIAMLLDYHAKNKQSFDFEIDAFDINAEAIETAKNARYTANTLRSDGAGWKYILDLYLAPDGNEYVVSHGIRGKVRFFPHNIMRGLEKQYDVIFFRNALIYFSSKNRLIVLNDLAESLFNNGLLFLGVSETSTVRHPLLANRNMSDVFFFQKIYYQKTHGADHFDGEHISRTERQDSGNRGGPAESVLTEPVFIKPERAKRIPSAPVYTKPAELPIDCGKTASILETEEGKPNAEKTLKILSDSETAASVSGSELAASVMYFLGVQDFNSADSVLTYLEKCNNGAVTMFLRGEYHLLQGSAKVAENFFEHAARKEKAFWPAFYRIVALAAEGNPTRYEYRIKKAIESLELSQNPETGRELHYECFLGGFSPDYFQRVLNQRLLSRQLLS